MRPEKILKSTSFGTAAVTIAITNAIETTAPVFCSITRAPAAMPRRCTGTTPIIAAVFGLLNMPEPMPTSESQTALQTYGGVRLEHRHPGEADRARRASRARRARASRGGRRSTPASGEAMSIPIAIGASSSPAMIGDWPCGPWK